jgi:hypothetical protein
MVKRDGQLPRWILFQEMKRPNTRKRKNQAADAVLWGIGF